MDSEEGDGSLAGELEEEHEDKDDEEGMEDWLLENISELKLLIAQHFRHFFVQSDEGVQVVLMESQDILGWENISMLKMIDYLFIRIRARAIIANYVER